MTVQYPVLRSANLPFVLSIVTYSMLEIIRYMLVCLSNNGIWLGERERGATPRVFDISTQCLVWIHRTVTTYGGMPSPQSSLRMMPCSPLRSVLKTGPNDIVSLI